MERKGRRERRRRRRESKKREEGRKEESKMRNTPPSPLATLKGGRNGEQWRETEED